MISAGGNDTCALTSAGAVRCFVRRDPIDSPGFESGIAAIAQGWVHACALTTIGGVRCMGSNDAGQLGDNTTTYRSAAVDVSGLASGVAAIAAGGRHSCALTTGGDVKCWGSNGHGQLGIHSTIDSLVPVEVSSLANNASAIATGQDHSCARMADAHVQCWGSDFYGELGGNSGTRYAPAAVAGLGSGIAAVAAWGWHSCALTTGGGVKCWGDGTPFPVDIAGLGGGVTAIAGGCALLAAGSVKCFSIGNPAGLVDLAGFGSGVAALAAGAWYTCALTTERWCEVHRRIRFRPDRRRLRSWNGCRDLRRRDQHLRDHHGRRPQMLAKRERPAGDPHLRTWAREQK